MQEKSVDKMRLYLARDADGIMLSKKKPLKTLNERFVVVTGERLVLPKSQFPQLKIGKYVEVELIIKSDRRIISKRNEKALHVLRKTLGGG